MTFDVQRTAAYGALHNTADTLRAMVANATSEDHPLMLSDDTVAAVKTALQWLYKAQREMEQSK